ncbi:MAG TPA: DUF72 domain-containing protein [Puia sp.]|nr:DUF72 domain-containing protein [Puia sp.]
MPEKIKFYAGTSGLLLPVPNKLFYPEEFRNKTRLAYYGSLFNSIEINSSFYKVPMPSTVARWATEVPENFKFTFKIHRGITHEKGLIFNPPEISSFIKTISEVGNKKGCLLIQLPPSIKIGDKSQLIRLLEVISDSNVTDGWSLSIEFRDNSWYTGSVYDLMSKLGIAIVIHDMPKSKTPLKEESQAIVYIRFHGPAGDYRGSYEYELLQHYRQNICSWLKQGKQVFLYFNNTIGDAMKNLIDMNQMVLNEFIEDKVPHKDDQKKPKLKTKPVN